MCRRPGDVDVENGKGPGRRDLAELIGTIEKAATEVSLASLLTSTSGQGARRDPKSNIKSVEQSSKDDNPKKRSVSPSDVIDMHLKVDTHGDSDNHSHGRASKRRCCRSKNHHGEEKHSHENDHGHHRSVVRHNYHDHAEYGAQLAAQETTAKELMDKKVGGGCSTAFPMILHQILDHAEVQGYADIISWQPHGRAFHVHDQDRFVQEVMPRYFRQTRFSSFQRQLSLYGFLRLTRKGEDHGAYYHELCLRGMPELCSEIQRTRVKGYGVRQSSSPQTEPDFYDMPAIGIPDPTPISAFQTKPLSPLPVTQPKASGTITSKTMPPLSLSAPVDAEYLVKNMTFPSIPLPTEAGSTNIAIPYSIDSLDYKLDARPDELLDGFEDIFKPESIEKSIDVVDTQVGQKTGGPEISQQEQEDLLSFLSDVDLDSDTEEEAYRNEDELGRIYTMQQMQHVKAHAVV